MTFYGFQFVSFANFLFWFGVLQWMKLDELLEQERQVRVSMTNRAGVLGLMLHSAYDHALASRYEQLTQQEKRRNEENERRYQQQRNQQLEKEKNSVTERRELSTPNSSSEHHYYNHQSVETLRKERKTSPNTMKFGEESKSKFVVLGPDNDHRYYQQAPAKNVVRPLQTDHQYYRLTTSQAPPGPIKLKVGPQKTGGGPSSKTVIQLHKSSNTAFVQQSPRQVIFSIYLLWSFFLMISSFLVWVHFVSFICLAGVMCRARIIFILHITHS